MNRTSIPGDLNDAEDPSGSSHITHHQDVQNPELSPSPSDHVTTRDSEITGADSSSETPAANNGQPLPHGRASRRASQIPELADLFAALGSSPVATTSNATIGTGNEDTSPVASTANAIIETDHEDNVRTDVVGDLNAELEDFEEPGDEPLRPTVDPSADNQLRVENFFRDLEDVLHLMNPAHPSVPRTLADHEIQALLDELETTTIGPLPDNSDGEAARCSICLEDDAEGDVLLVLRCHASHHFHRECLQSSLRVSAICPLCRAAIGTQEGEEEH
ncbi:hypothetical protein MJO28_011859 [Puccinia striiformis f. sp. tritici]|uniref:RING-type domain-containing protein n=3 Tax=Puccinia striiformis TaxID=27350 RepID=A0A2S4V1K7_9BASI|nr:hypothetical protein Pst134EB_022299 [Puccinia striiformis f. sp. tritici]KAI7944331.1 hypothetical protein MJO28_011859 [Puccinia striiformis f. sp. tritici]KAI7947088.1 hypothetical protein MJO29_011615 [Puccinia striiformis f. sp. tritici]KAI9627728.1 hypothetical protein KEM48_012057 [Puccinia striiformis f. sp. tritici PST-130]POW03393.1 hypothetical protein PSTT_11133 [Puccinia striiformis]